MWAPAPIAQTYLAVLHDVELSQPRLIERIASGVYDMTQSVLFRDNKHSVEQALHRVRRADQGRPGGV